MGDLISRSRLKAELDAWAKIVINPQYYLKEDADFVIDTQAAVDVVLCKECLFYEHGEGCPLYKSGFTKKGIKLPLENDFCSYGKRK